VRVGHVGGSCGSVEVNFRSTSRLFAIGETASDPSTMLA
jgi:hypothetical protein